MSHCYNIDINMYVPLVTTVEPPIKDPPRGGHNTSHALQRPMLSMIKTSLQTTKDKMAGHSVFFVLLYN